MEDSIKDTLRVQMREVVNGFTAEQVDAKSKLVLERFFASEEYARARNILVYMPYPYEVNINLGMDRMFAEKKVALPFLSEEDEMIMPGVVKSLVGVKKGVYGVYSNKKVAKKMIPWGKVDLILVPALAFDERGYRLGIGNGSYDHLLRYLGKKEACKNLVRVGLAFEYQMRMVIPHAEKDMPMHKIITDERVLECKG